MNIWGYFLFPFSLILGGLIRQTEGINRRQKPHGPSCYIRRAVFGSLQSLSRFGINAFWDRIRVKPAVPRVITADISKTLKEFRTRAFPNGSHLHHWEWRVHEYWLGNWHPYLWKYKEVVRNTLQMWNINNTIFSSPIYELNLHSQMCSLSHTHGQIDHWPVFSLVVNKIRISWFSQKCFQIKKTNP